IDTLSFERYTEGRPWMAYRQFCQHFLAPLLLMANVDIRLGGLFRQHLDGVPLDLASRLLPRRSWGRLSTLLHVHLHARSLARYAEPEAGAEADRRVSGARVGRHGLDALLDSLTGAIRRLE